MGQRFRHDFNKLNRLPPYSLGEVIALMRAARRAGEDIVDLGMGNPDLPTPPHVVDWLKSKQIEIVPVSFRDTMELGCNVMSLGKDRVLSPASSKDLNGKLRAMGFEVYDPDASMFLRAGGGIHCMSQPLKILLPASLAMLSWTVGIGQQSFLVTSLRRLQSARSESNVCLF